MARSSLAPVVGLALLSLAADKPAHSDLAGDAIPDSATVRLGTLRWRLGAAPFFAGYLPDGKSLVTVNAAYQAQVWDAADGTLKSQFAVDGGPLPNDGRRSLALFGVVLSGDGKTLVNYGRYGDLHVWDLQSGKERCRIPPKGTGNVPRLAVSPDGKTVAVSGGGGLLVLWNAMTGKQVRQLSGGDDAGRCKSYRLEFTSDGKKLYQFGTQFEDAHKPGVVVWDTESGTEEKRLTEVPGGGTQSLLRSTFSPDRSRMAIPDGEKVVVLDLKTGKAVVEVKPDQMTQHPNLHFTPDGKHLAVMSGRNATFDLYELDKGKAVVSARPDKKEDAVDGPKARPAVMAMAPDGKSIAWIDGMTVRHIDLKTGKDRPAAGHTAAVKGLRFTPDGKSVWTHGADGTARRWDVGTGKEAAVLEAGPPGCAFDTSPDGKYLGAAMPGGGIRMLETAGGKELYFTKPVSGLVGSIVNFGFSSDGKTLAAVGTRDEVMACFFEAATGKKTLEIFQLCDPMPGANRLRTRAPAFSPDGTLLALPGIEGSLTLYDMASGKEVRKFQLPIKSAVRRAVFSPDGRSVVADLFEGPVAVFETTNGHQRLGLGERKPELMVLTEPAVPGTIRIARRRVAFPTLAVSPDGRLLARGEEQRIKVFDARTGDVLGQLEGHRGDVQSLAFSPDGKTLASGSTDTTTLLWDTAALRKKLTSPAAPLTKDRLAACWTELGDGNAGQAYQAVRELAGDPKQALPLLRDRIKAAKVPDAKTIAKMIVDLDSDQFETRDKARKALEELGEAAESALRETLKGDPSAEVRKQAEELLDRLRPMELVGRELRAVRALEVLEWVGTAEAIELIQALADGPDTTSTRHAKATLRRLRK